MRTKHIIIIVYFINQFDFFINLGKWLYNIDILIRVVKSGILLRKLNPIQFNVLFSRTTKSSHIYMVNHTVLTFLLWCLTYLNKGRAYASLMYVMVNDILNELPEN